MTFSRVFYTYRIAAVQSDHYEIDHDDFLDWCGEPLEGASDEKIIEYMQADRDFDRDREDLLINEID